MPALFSQTNVRNYSIDIKKVLAFFERQHIGLCRADLYLCDPGMVTRVREFMQAAEQVRGKPIPLLSSSWGPPAYLKSNNDRRNGGNLQQHFPQPIQHFGHDHILPARK